MTATTTLILIVENLIQKVSDDDGALKSALDGLKTELATDEAAEAALADRVTALEGAISTPPDLTALTARVQALEDRNAADDAAAAAAPGVPPAA